MPRSGAEARRRLQQAALELYHERGYDATTAAQIAERAGVTERTYFRHFADKREVLFDGQAELLAALTGAIHAADPAVPPLAAVMAAYRAAVPLFVAGRPIAERRAAVIAESAALQERARGKEAVLLDGVIAALAARGIELPTARLAALVGSAAFDRAYAAWRSDSDSSLVRQIDDAEEEVRRLG